LFASAGVFTDDSVLSCAVADAILNRRSFKEALLHYTRRYPDVGYGYSYKRWARSLWPRPYRSFGNGSAMRVSAVGWACGSLEETLQIAKASAQPTHNHKEGIKGAQAVAAAIYLARTGSGKEAIRDYLAKQFNYKLNASWADYKAKPVFNYTCQSVLPQVVAVLLESNSTLDAINKAIALGGDTDTLACITGSITEALYADITSDMAALVKSKLTPDLW
jgi:ADP-ribosylglycohydrolase